MKGKRILLISLSLILILVGGWNLTSSRAAGPAYANGANGDGYADLAIGIPNRDVNNGTIVEGGAIQVKYGSSPDGLIPTGSQGFSVMTEAGDHFGYALAAGDVEYDAFCPAVAYNSADNQYPVVWWGNDDTGDLVKGEYDIFGQLVDAATGLALLVGLAFESSRAQIQRRLLLSREEERARLARDLHDGPIQVLVGLNLQLGLLLSQGASSQAIGTDSPLDEQFLEMRSEVQDLLVELRGVCAELRPPMLDTLGLGAAIRALAGDWSEQHGAPVNLDLPPNASLRDLPSEVSVNLYRVAQEALCNTARHAKAGQVSISLAWQDDCLYLRVQDDGCGFTPPRASHDLTSQGHFGLVGMRERVDLIGGQLSLQSEPGKGTTVSVRWGRSKDALQGVLGINGEDAFALR